MLMATAFGAGAAGLDGELNPVRMHPHGSPDAPVERLIIKLRSAARADAVTIAAATPEEAQIEAGRRRVAVLAGRHGLILKMARPITARMHVVHLEPALAGESVATTLEALRADPEVEYAEVDQRRYAHATPNDSLFLTQQWYLQNSATTPSAIDAVTAWDTTKGSTGLVIADLDTGVRFEHPDLQWAGSGGRLLPGYCFISDAFTANGGNCPGPDASDPGDWVASADLSKPECTGVTSAQNSSWHGTRTAGLLGAITDNNTGIAGMTWNAWLLPVRVLGKCGGFDSDIAAAMLWADGIAVSGAPANTYPAKIINMSLGATGSCTQTEMDAINQVTAQGVLVVVSAGNEGGPVDSPANCTGVAGVAGLRHAGTKVGYSSLGPEIALSAPAGNCPTGSPCTYPITTTFNTGTTTPMTNSYTDQVNNLNLGTSFSAPLVSGIAGLMLSVNGNLNSTQLIVRLKEGSLPFPQTSSSPPAPGCPTAPQMCHVPAGPSDLQTCECICTLDGKTCGAGMANASGALNAALRPIAVVKLPASVTAGMNITLDASGSGAACKHTVASYQWASSDPAGHPVNPATGSSTTVIAPASGTFSVTLTVTDDAGKVDQATVTVSSTAATSSAPAMAGTTACLTAISVPSGVTVSVSPPTGSLQAGSGTTETLTATVGNTVNTQVTWQVNTITGGNATVGTITTGGVYTVPTTVPSPATVTVTAVSAADSTRSGSATITITAPSSGGGGGGGGGALDVLSLLALTLGGLTRAISRPYNSR